MTQGCANSKGVKVHVARGLRNSCGFSPQLRNAILSRSAVVLKLSKDERPSHGAFSAVAKTAYHFRTTLNLPGLVGRPAPRSRLV